MPQPSGCLLIHSVSNWLSVRFLNPSHLSAQPLSAGSFSLTQGKTKKATKREAGRQRISDPEAAHQRKQRPSLCENKYLVPLTVRTHSLGTEESGGPGCKNRERGVAEMLIVFAVPQTLIKCMACHEHCEVQRCYEIRSLSWRNLYSIFEAGPKTHTELGNRRN